MASDLARLEEADATRIRKAQLFLSSISLHGATQAKQITPEKELSSGSEDEDERGSSSSPPPVERILFRELTQASDLVNTRILLCAPRAYPHAALSVLTTVSKKKTLPKTDDETKLQEVLHNQTWSYKHLVKPGCVLKFTAHKLDDPDLRHGKHQQVLQWLAYRVSVTQYAKSVDLKQELNMQFRELFPHVNITLTKLRSIKRAMFRFGYERCSLDVGTIALAHIFFEKLIVNCFLNKPNRKIFATLSLMLALKFNMEKDEVNDKIRMLREVIESEWKLSWRDVLEQEFAVFAALELHLHVSPAVVQEYVQRIAIDHDLNDL
eukprot:m.53182 g.53182  ORF g.53182 m.53182 type:complete len:322 (+) comp13136_c0_seq1:57-1022(+)